MGDHGWQLIVPLRSRKGDQQMAENPRIVTVYVGSKIGPLVGPDEELDGEAWEPTSSMVPSKSIGIPSKVPRSEMLPPPPPPDLGGGAFEEAPPPPPLPGESTLPPSKSKASTAQREKEKEDSSDSDDVKERRRTK